MTVVPLPVPWENVAPRDAANRYRIYAVRDGALGIPWTTPNAEGIGVALVTLADEGEFEDAAVGILDTKGAPEESGVWIVNPFAGRRS